MNEIIKIKNSSTHSYYANSTVEYFAKWNKISLTEIWKIATLIHS